jgi:hypothetical protein
MTAKVKLIGAAAIIFHCAASFSQNQSGNMHTESASWYTPIGPRLTPLEMVPAIPSGGGRVEFLNRFPLPFILRP